MEIGIIGLGAVGSAIKRGFEYIGHNVVGYDIKIESTLTNGLLIIHPLILYTYYSVLLLFLFYTLYEGVSPSKPLQNYSFNLKKTFFYKIGILALILGS